MNLKIGLVLLPLSCDRNSRNSDVLTKATYALTLTR